jgi:adenylate cyclase class IV
MIEKELKFLIDRKVAVSLKAEMKQSGGLLIYPRTREAYTVYDDDAGSLQVQDARLSLQSGANYSISYERAISKRGFRQGLVLATAVTSLAQMKKILMHAGFRPISRYSCYRTTWEIGSSKVSINEFTFGIFAEISGELQSINRLAQKFRFKPTECITASYDDLYRRSKNTGVSLNE